MRASHLRLALSLALVLAMALVLVACSGGATNPYGTTTGTSTGSGSGAAGAPAAGTTISEKNIAFNPSALTVKVGDTVTFTNDDTVPHHVFVGGEDLGEQAPGVTKTWKAAKAGAFPVKCVIHPSMTGQITVQ